MRNAVILSNGKVVDGDDPAALLKKQYDILMKLSRIRTADAELQTLLGDANHLGLAVVDWLKENKP